MLNRTIQCLLAIIPTFVLPSCGQIDNNPSSIGGAVIFENHPGIQKIQLSNLKIDTVYKLGSFEHIYGMSSYTKTNMIVSLSVGHEFKEYALYVLDIGSSRKTKIGNGQWPQVIYTGDGVNLVYVDATSEGYSLVSARLESGKIIKTNWKLHSGLEPQKRWTIDEKTIAFKGAEDEVWFVDLGTGQYKVKTITDCHPDVWLSRRKQFVCLNTNTKAWALTDIDLTSSAPLEGMSAASPAFYEVSIDTLFVQPHSFSLKRGEVYGMGVYNFKKKSVDEIADKMISFSSFWVEH
ncbi:MAG: hypothetical protein OEY58_22160 [Gammaproteobacteria bacterium]|nr:hypothetical protein [Gammaproteobacteria bacterium]